ERNQRAEIMVDERFERPTFQSALDLLLEVGRLLVRRLGARRNRPFLAVRHQTATIAHGARAAASDRGLPSRRNETGSRANKPGPDSRARAGQRPYYRRQLRGGGASTN